MREVETGKLPDASLGDDDVVDADVAVQQPLGRVKKVECVAQLSSNKQTLHVLPVHDKQGHGTVPP